MVCVICGLCDRETLKIPEIYHFLELCLTENSQCNSNSCSSLCFFIQENAYLWRTSLYLAASASAEFFADIALAPMEAAKVRIQTQPGYANTLRDAAPKMYKEEGLKA